MRNLISRLALLAVIVIPAVGCDQVSKELARSNLEPGLAVESFGPIVTLVLVENSGSFLSLGSGLPYPVRLALFRWFPLLLLTGLAFYLILSASVDRLDFLAGSLILAGGIGNLLDRFFRGGLVTDFLYLQFGPLHTGIFNVADLFITTAAFLLILQWWRDRRSSREYVEPITT